MENTVVSYYKNRKKYILQDILKYVLVFIVLIGVLVGVFFAFFNISPVERYQKLYENTVELIQNENLYTSYYEDASWRDNITTITKKDLVLHVNRQKENNYVSYNYDSKIDDKAQLRITKWEDEYLFSYSEENEQLSFKSSKQPSSFNEVDALEKQLKPILVDATHFKEETLEIRGSHGSASLNLNAFSTKQWEYIISTMFEEEINMNLYSIEDIYYSFSIDDGHIENIHYYIYVQKNGNNEKGTYSYSCYWDDYEYGLNVSLFEVATEVDSLDEIIEEQLKN